MADGPLCLQMEKYYGHSRMLYKDPEQEQIDQKKYDNLWDHSLKHSKKEMREILALSDDKGRHEIGMQVI